MDEIIKKFEDEINEHKNNNTNLGEDDNEKKKKIFLSNTMKIKFKFILFSVLSCILLVLPYLIIFVSI